jgi:hypothetical protein
VSRKTRFTRVLEYVDTSMLVAFYLLLVAPGPHRLVAGFGVAQSTAGNAVLKIMQGPWTGMDWEVWVVLFYAFSS